MLDFFLSGLKVWLNETETLLAVRTYVFNTNLEYLAHFEKANEFLEEVLANFHTSNVEKTFKCQYFEAYAFGMMY